MHQKILVRVFTRVHTNMEPCWSKSWPAFFGSQTCTLSRSKFHPVPPVLCKRKVELCQFLSMQRFVRTLVNGALVVNCRSPKGHHPAETTPVRVRRWSFVTSLLRITMMTDDEIAHKVRRKKTLEAWNFLLEQPWSGWMKQSNEQLQGIFRDRGKATAWHLICFYKDVV